MEQATPRPGDRAPVAQVSVRALAEELGLSKDTVADGLQVLRTAGLVARVDQSKDGTGRFVRGAYRLHLHRPIRSIQPKPATTAPRPDRLDTRAHQADDPPLPAAPVAQLSLLDLS